MNELSDLPMMYFVVLALVIALTCEAALDLRRTWARPAIALYATIAAWYLGDMLYNGPAEFYGQFSPDTVNIAFLQVILFLTAYRMLLLLGAGLFVRDRRPTFLRGRPRQENGLLLLVGGIWAVTSLIGFARVDFDVWSLVFPPLSADPAFLWSRSAVGSGLDFMVSFLDYAHMAACGLLGVLAVLVRPKLRAAAFVLFVAAIQVYLFQRARNRMLGVLMPGLLAYLLVSPGRLWTKAAVGAAAFFAISTWFLFIIGSRDKEGDFIERIEMVRDANSSGELKHHGLNMLEELCWHEVLMSSGAYSPLPAARYFAEVAVIVPRSIWPDKPFVGIDFAVARGYGGANTAHGVHATISSGMIGQGVQNFGPFVGPLAAAALAAGWNWVLARLWVRRADYLRLGLFLLGMGLTYNMGRDITLLVLFPFLFSYLGVKGFEIVSRSGQPTPAPA